MDPGQSFIDGTPAPSLKLLRFLLEEINLVAGSCFKLPSPHGISYAVTRFWFSWGGDGPSRPFYIVPDEKSFFPS